MISMGLLGHLSCAMAGRAAAVAKAARAIKRMRWFM
jgi:hypothetical protein